MKSNSARIALSALFLLPVLALAETPAAGPASPLAPFLPLILIFGVFYFLVLRPQQKKTKEHARFITELKRGDVIVTASGIIGSIRTVGEKFVTLEIDDGVCLKVIKSQISENARSLSETKPATQLQEQKS